MKTMKHFKGNLFLKLAILAFCPLPVFSQNLTGMWTGKIYTTEKTLTYEVAITEKDGKLSGFSYTTFDVKGEEMVAMKSIIVKQDKKNIIIEDVDLVYNSFDEESPKQLKQTNTLELEIVNDKTMLLIGKFKTLKTDKFRSMSGGVRLRKDSIIEKPKLIAKLDEMELSKSLSFLAPPEVPQEEVAKIDNSIKESVVVAGAEKQIATPTMKAPPTVAKPKAKPLPIMSSTPAATVAATRPTATAPITAVSPVPVVAKKAEPRAASASFSNKFGDRTLETIQTVVFKSDSLQFTLYDNGEVDGDTVSVFLNGKPIMSKQGLSTKAINKTVYFTPEMGDSMQLIMYAENLGTIAPNTGLLIIKDGRDRYEIRFAGDLKKNASIILKRKREE